MDQSREQIEREQLRQLARQLAEKPGALRLTVQATWYVLAVRFRTSEWCATAALLGRPEDDDRLAQVEAGAAELLAGGHRLVNHPKREDAEREVVTAFADLRLALRDARQRMHRPQAAA